MTRSPLVAITFFAGFALLAVKAEEGRLLTKELNDLKENDEHNYEERELLQDSSVTKGSGKCLPSKSGFFASGLEINSFPRERIFEVISYRFRASIKQYWLHQITDGPRPKLIPVTLIDHENV